MQFYKIAGDPLDFLGGYTVHEDATSGYYDAEYVRGAAATEYTAKAVMELDSPVPLDNPDGAWVHVAVCAPDDYTSSYDEMEHVFQVFDSNGDYLAKSNDSSNGAFELELFASDGSSAMSPTSDGGAMAVARTTYDVHLFTDAGGKGQMRFYVGGGLVLAVEVAAPLSDLKSVSFGTGREDKFTYYSEGIISDRDTRRMRVKSFYPSADGTYTDGGADGYQLVDGVDLDGVTLDLTSVGDQHSFLLSGAGTTPVSGVVGMSITAHVAAGTGNDVALGLRVGGSDAYDSALGAMQTISPGGVTWSLSWPGGAQLPQSLDSAELLVKAV